jgi:hypothetical protein
MYVFVFVNVQERIFKKMTKNHEKMTKRARDLEKCQKPEPGKLVDKVKAHIVVRSPQSFRNYKNGPWS